MVAGEEGGDGRAEEHDFVIGVGGEEEDVVLLAGTVFALVEVDCKQGHAVEGQQDVLE